MTKTGTQHPGLRLLLANAEDGHPVLAGALRGETLSIAPRPPRDPGRAGVPRLAASDADPNSLREQRWGVIAPHGVEGDRMLAAIAPLVTLREREQGAEARCYRVDPDLDAKASLRFFEREVGAEHVPEHERPRYLLLLGDLHQVSIELQQVLAQKAFVGRVHVADTDGATSLAGYTAYAEKVVRWADHATSADGVAAKPDALFFVAHDGTPATQLAYRELVVPCLRDARAWQHRAFPAAAIVEVPQDDPGPDTLLQAAEQARTPVLLSVSHGLGRPREGWTSAEAQRARQGALAMGRGTELDAERLRTGRFLQGGMWFCLACFGAGTPSTSAFHAWLSLLATEGRATASGVEGVLRHLPRAGERPFLAALPQAALANPEGPLAVIGHIDLSWAYSFLGGRGMGESRASRILSAIRAMVRGSRAGVALDALMRSYRETNDVLMSLYQGAEDARLRGVARPFDPAQLGELWMQRNDLRGYVLLGDPAARLSLAA